MTNDLFMNSEEIIRNEFQLKEQLIGPKIITENGLLFNEQYYWDSWMLDYLDYEVFVVEKRCGKVEIYDWCSCDLLGEASLC